MSFKQAKQIMLDSPDTSQFYTCDEEIDDFEQLCNDHKPKHK